MTISLRNCKVVVSVEEGDRKQHHIHCLKDQRPSFLLCWFAFLWVSCFFFTINCWRDNRKRFPVYRKVRLIPWRLTMRYFHIWRNFRIKLTQVFEVFRHFGICLTFRYRVKIINLTCWIHSAEWTKDGKCPLPWHNLNSFDIFCSYLYDVAHIFMKQYIPENWKDSF